MYELRVFKDGGVLLFHSGRVDRAEMVLERIPLILGSHPDCELVEVYLSGTRLFGVDCAGNRIGQEPARPLLVGK
jgi:hypothetical protein